MSNTLPILHVHVCFSHIHVHAWIKMITWQIVGTSAYYMYMYTTDCKERSLTHGINQIYFLNTKSFIITKGKEIHLSQFFFTKFTPSNFESWRFTLFLFQGMERWSPGFSPQKTLHSTVWRQHWSTFQAMYEDFTAWWRGKLEKNNIIVSKCVSLLIGILLIPAWLFLDECYGNCNEMIDSRLRRSFD